MKPGSVLVDIATATGGNIEDVNCNQVLTPLRQKL